MTMAPIPEHNHFERPTAHRQEFPLVRRWSYLFILIIIGLTSGALGFALLSTYIIPYGGFDHSSTVVSDARLAGIEVVTTPIAIASDATVSVVRHTDRALLKGFDAVPSPTDFLASAIAVTSDGWMMSSAKNIVKTGSYDIYRDGSYYPVAEIRVDDVTHVTFMKVAGLELRPIEFAPNEPGIGDAVYFISDAGLSGKRFSMSRVAQADYFPIVSKQDYSKPSDSIGHFTVVLPQPPGAASFGFDGQGRVLGIINVNPENTLTAAKYLNVAVDRLLRNEAFSDIGIWYYEDRIASDRYTRAATIYHPSHNAIKAGSRAARAQLKVNDAIVAVGNEILSRSNTFDYLWQKHQGDQQLTITVVRNGVPVDIAIP